MTTGIQTNEKILTDYEAQWESLEKDLEISSIDEKMKKITLSKFRELKKEITKEASYLKDVMSFAGFVSILSVNTQHLADIILDSKVKDAIFEGEQKKLLEEKSDETCKERFSLEDSLIALALENLEI